MKRVLLALLFSAAAAAQLPDVVINNLTGSDTAASGAPASFGPFSAAGTCHTNGAASMTIQWAANPLAGVPTDGSAVLWMATASGRRWSKITARAADTVTVEDSFNIAAASAVDCAVGGKRQTISGARLFTDAKQAWQYSVEYTGTDYSVSAGVGGMDFATCGDNLRWFLRGTGAQRPRLVQTANASLFNIYCINLSNFEVENTNGTKTNSAIFGQTAGNAHVAFRNLTFIGWQQVFGSGGGEFLGVFYNVEVRNGGTNGFNFGLTTSALILANYAHDNAGAGFANAQRSVHLYNLAADNTGDGLACNLGCNLFHNTSYSNGGDGFETDNGIMSWFAGNLSTDNTGFGLRSTGGSAVVTAAVVDNNSYNGNTAGARSATAPVGANDLTAVAPMYAGAPTNLQPLAAGLLGAGFPLNTLAAGGQSTTVTFTEPGASQRSGGADGNYAY